MPFPIEPDSSSESESASILVEHTNLVARVVAAMRAETELLTLNDYAEIAGISPFYFNRIFRSIIGVPPGEFATSVRFERAKHLLLTTPASITDICFEVGYSSIGTFSTRFKSLVGVSPASFRDMPDVVADLDFGQAVFRMDPKLIHARGRIEGTMNFPPDQEASIFIGIYPAKIAVSSPVVGRMLTEPGPFELTNVPYGTWVVMSAALPTKNDPVRHLLPMGQLLVSSSAPFNIFPGDDVAQVHLNYGRPGPLQPPVVIALPTLLLD